MILAESHLLGPSQASRPAPAGRTADSSPPCRQSTNSSTRGQRSPWPSWGPVGLSLEQKELERGEGRKPKPSEEPPGEVWDAAAPVVGLLVPRGIRGLCPDWTRSGRPHLLMASLQVTTSMSIPALTNPRKLGEEGSVIGTRAGGVCKTCPRHGSSDPFHAFRRDEAAGTTAVPPTGPGGNKGEQKLHGESSLCFPWWNRPPAMSSL